MSQADDGDQSTAQVRHPHGHRLRRRIGLCLAAILVGYLLIAYVIAPFAWRRYAGRHPALDAIPNITYTADDHPGDPLNVALIGSHDDVVRAMQSAQWRPAAALGLRSDLAIATDTVLSRPDADAPVSSLYLFHRKEDLAFEQPVGNNPRQRHHVRFWRCTEVDEHGRPLWIGSASYDEHVGLSHTTGQITHHISGDVDAERDHLMNDLQQAGALAERYAVDDFHKIREGRNGGGDPWHTDGKLFVGLLKIEP
jgi:hypothetical protein